MENIGICNLCKQECSLIKAHILPKSFSKILNDEKGKNVRYGKSGKRWYTDYLPFGRYLCKDCDNFFSSEEKEFAKLTSLLLRGGLLVRNEVGVHINIDSADFNRRLYIEDFDARKIKCALLFLLYKCSIDERAIMVNLGDVYEEILRKMLKEKELYNERISIYLAYYPSSEVIRNNNHKRYFSMRRTRVLGGDLVSGVNMTCIFIPGGLEAFFRIDQRDLPDLRNDELNEKLRDIPITPYSASIFDSIHCEHMKRVMKAQI